MDLSSGYPFWPIKNGLLSTYPPLTCDQTCAVAVIGGGITGALVAFHLAEAGIETVLLERRDVGQGSTAASTCLLQYEIDTPLVDLIEMRGEADAVRAYYLCLEAIGKLEHIAGRLDQPCDFECRQSLYLASRRSDQKSLRQEYEARKKYGIRVDWLEQREIEQRFSFSRPAAILSDDAAQLDVYQLTHALLQSATRQGLAVYDRTSVVRIEAGGQGHTLTTDRGPSITAKTVIFATGYETEGYLKQRVSQLKSTYALVSEPVERFPGWEERCLIWETARPYLYMRTTSDNRIIVGGEDEDFRDPARRDRLIRKKTELLKRRFQKMFPEIPLEVAYAWTGTFGETQDGLAYIGQTREFPGCYFALGFGGNGITYSLVAAELIRDAILGHPSRDLEIFRFDR